MPESINPQSNLSILPQTEMLEIGKRKTFLDIGIPCEVNKCERRIALTPQAVSTLVNIGHKVTIETAAGSGANYSDHEYSEAGAIIVAEKVKVFQNDIILKVSPFSLIEMDYLRENQIVFSSLHLTSQRKENILKLMEKRVKAIAYEYLKTKENFYPVVHSMSEISGSTAMMIASEYLSIAHGGKGVLLGGITGITPTDVIILGSGTAAEYAARTALGLGAIVKIFDNSVYNLKKFQKTLGRQVITSILHHEVLIKALKSADVVIGAMDSSDVPVGAITEDLVRVMKKGSVIIDLNVDSGSAFETSQLTNLDNPTFVKHGVIHFCVPNIPARVSRTASIALSNVLNPIIQNIGASGGVAKYLHENIDFRTGAYIYNGILTNHALGKKVGIPAKDINLLMAAF